MPHDVIADHLAAFTIREQLGQGAQLAGMNGNNVIPADEEIHVYRPDETGFRAETGKLEDQEQIVVIVVQLGQLHPA